MVLEGFLAAQTRSPVLQIQVVVAAADLAPETVPIMEPQVVLVS
jgi:hypothetical protein